MATQSIHRRREVWTWWQQVFKFILEWKESSVEIQFLNTFKDHPIAAFDLAVINYDRWPLSNFLWMEFYSGHNKYKPKLSEYFQMYQFQLNFAVLCAIIALGIS